MSNTTILSINNLKATVPESFVFEDMRDDFMEIVRQCDVTERLSSKDFKQPPIDSKGLVPVAYNLIVEALKNPELLKKLKANASLFGYWFFNVFIIPPDFEDLSPIDNNAVTGVTKDITKGLGHIGLDL